MTSKQRNAGPFTYHIAQRLTGDRQYRRWVSDGELALRQQQPSTAVEALPQSKASAGVATRTRSVKATRQVFIFDAPSPPSHRVS